MDVLVLNRCLEHLGEQRDCRVDRAVGKRATLFALAVADLAGAVAINLGDRDLGEAMVLEEWEQVAGERPLVVLDGARGDLVAARLEPLRGELVEGGVLGGCGGRRGLWWLPGPAADVGEDILQLGVRAAAGVALP